MHALELLSRKEVDLVITDLNMPNLDGFELLKTLREDQKFRDLPVIILSSLDSEEERQRSKELGANSFLVKPFNQQRIQYEVAKFIN
ncbi:MAG: response regulator [Methanobacteriota archaeon]|nr:MAG: response regulator [Euryarchaeota archaeon]